MRSKAAAAHSGKQPLKDTRVTRVYAERNSHAHRRLQNLHTMHTSMRQLRATSRLASAKISTGTVAKSLLGKAAVGLHRHTNRHFTVVYYITMVKGILQTDSNLQVDGFVIASSGQIWNLAWASEHTCTVTGPFCCDRKTA